MQTIEVFTNGEYPQRLPYVQRLMFPTHKYLIKLPENYTEKYTDQK